MGLIMRVYEVLSETIDKPKVDYDLVSDIIMFMRDDTEVYRKHLFPAIVTAYDRLDSNQPLNAKMFIAAVQAAYPEYYALYKTDEPGLKSQLERKDLVDTCRAIKRMVINQHSKGEDAA
jgi:hypothetical protein